MNIAVVGPTYPYRGGISHYNTLLCRHLRETHDVCLYTFRRQYPRWLFPGRDDRDPSRSVLSTPAVPILDPLNPVTWWQTGCRVVAGRPDALVLHWWVTYWALPFAAIAAIARRHRIPVLYICHNILPHEEKPWDHHLARLALSLGDQYVVMADSEARRLRALHSDAVIQHVSHPTYLALAEMQDAPPTGEARRQLGLDPQQPVALFFGFVRPYKGLRFLLEALPDVLTHVNLSLLIVGEFWEDRQGYVETVEYLGLSESVTMVDRYVPNEEVGIYFAAADVVVLPYTSVTQSGVVQLAYGFGKPVITTSVSGLSGVVVDRETGLIVPPRDSRALARALVEFYQGLRTRNWEPDIRRRLQDFSWQPLVEVIEGLSTGRGAAAQRETSGCV